LRELGLQLGNQLIAPLLHLILPVKQLAAKFVALALQFALLFLPVEFFFQRGGMFERRRQIDPQSSGGRGKAHRAFECPLVQQTVDETGAEDVARATGIHRR